MVPNERWKASGTSQWLMLQMGGVGPLLGQAHHFRRAKT
jgi:GST-like protein